MRAARSRGLEWLGRTWPADSPRWAPRPAQGAEPNHTDPPLAGTKPGKPKEREALGRSWGGLTTVYSRHRRWSGDGSREKIVDALRVGCDEAEGKARTVAADATVVRAHQHAAGARHAPPKDIPAERLAVNRGTATGKPKPGALFACEQQARARDQADRRGGQSCACAAHHDRPVRSGPLLRQLGATQRTSELR